MKIPEEWIEQIVNELKNSPFLDVFYTVRTPEELENIARNKVKNFIETEFNNDWQFNTTLIEKFKPFFISTCIHQCSTNMHPLTCGVNSDHLVLLPRIMQNGDCYLVCPTCGWIQTCSWLF